MKIVTKVLAFSLCSVSAFAAIIGPKDNRLTYREFAASKLNGDRGEVSRMFSAAGLLDCDDTVGSASVVRNNNIMVTAGHMLYGVKNGSCRPKKLSTCFFQVIDKDGRFGRKVPIRPETVTVSRNYSCDRTEFGIDWALAKLRYPIDEISPFSPVDVSQFDSSSGFRYLTGSQVYILAATSANLTNNPRLVPTICQSTVGYVWPLNASSGDMSFGVGIGCSGGRGNSGGAILREDGGRLQFLAVTSVSMNSNYDHKPFDNNNFTALP